MSESKSESEADARADRKRRLASLARLTKPVPSVDDRMAAGKALRAKHPLATHASYRPKSTRQDPVAVLEDQAKTRLKVLIPIRYARMLSSPFAFLRGAAAALAADLAPTPVTGLTVQACGDMHLANFGVFASAERNLVFGINDFDETLPGAWEWDLKRLAASAVVAARFLGGDNAVAEAAARATVRSYRKRIREYARMGHVAVWYSRISAGDILSVIAPELRERTRQIIAKARGRGHIQVLQKMSELVDDRHRIVEQRPLIVRETRTHDGRPIGEVIGPMFEAYISSLPEERRQLIARYRIVDVARKVVGVGSVGTRCWVVLLTGNGADDPLFLQYKEAQTSVLAPYSKTAALKPEGKRVVVGQRLIQGAPDIFLGWATDRHAGEFYIRQLRDMKGGAVLDPAVTPLKAVPEYCKICGWALALAHAKSGDPAMIAGYLGKSDAMDEAVARFAFAYAEQTDRDYDALKRAAKQKRIQVAKTA
jgi:uncharacterized protein (DUF2252 family)